MQPITITPAAATIVQSTTADTTIAATGAVPEMNAAATVHLTTIKQLEL
jgi:hypothetical protein